MGFDLSGMNPNFTTPEPTLPPWNERTDKDWKRYTDWQEENSGVYFRNNVWWWRPLWMFVSEACSDILTDKDIEMGSFNGGHKISKTKARRIAGRINKLNRNGSLNEYVNGRNQIIKELPDEKCNICEGTGKRKKPPAIGPGDIECNGCSGKGKCRPFACNYRAYEDDIIEFAEFCKHSGGFTIS